MGYRRRVHGESNQGRHWVHNSDTAVISRFKSKMEFFRFVPPTLVALSTACFVLVAAIPMPQPLPLPQDTPADVTRLEAAPGPASFSRALPSQPVSAPAAPRASNPQTNSRFLPPGLFQAPVTNQNQGLQNTLAAGGLGALELWLLEDVCLVGTVTSPSDPVR